MSFVDPLGLFILPNDPSGLSKDWFYDPSHQYAFGDRFRNPAGDVLDYHRVKPGNGKGNRHRDKPHWHFNERDVHLYPGEECPDSNKFEDTVLPFTPFPFMPAPGSIPVMPSVPLPIPFLPLEPD